MIFILQEGLKDLLKECEGRILKRGRCLLNDGGICDLDILLATFITVANELGFLRGIFTLNLIDYANDILDFNKL